MQIPRYIRASLGEGPVNLRIYSPPAPRPRSPCQRAARSSTLKSIVSTRSSPWISKGFKVQYLQTITGCVSRLSSVISDQGPSSMEVHHCTKDVLHTFIVILLLSRLLASTRRISDFWIAHSHSAANPRFIAASRKNKHYANFFIF